MQHALLVLLALLTVMAPRAALARTETHSETLKPTSKTDVLNEPNGKHVVGTMEPGHEYNILKQGGPNGTWCKVELDSQQGWVRCDVSASAASAIPSKPAPVGSASGCATTCKHAPLFSKPPELTPLDREVLSICPARPDASVTSPDVRRFVTVHLSDARLQRALSVAGRSGSREANIDWLTDLWTGKGPRNAFTHVFCGDDWNRDELGGLHFLPRYAQLEQEGRLCFSGSVQRSGAVTGGQYLIRYKGVAPWSCGEKKVGGFPIEHDPVALMAVGVRAFARCCHRGSSSDGGVFQASDLGGTRYQIWCGTRNGTYGIATLYPTNDRATCGE